MNTTQRSGGAFEGLNVVVLAGATIEGFASEDQRRQLNDLLVADPAARRQYIDHMLLRALLVEMGGAIHAMETVEEPIADIVPASVNETLELSVAEVDHRFRSRGLRVKKRPRFNMQSLFIGWTIAATALIAAGLSIAYWWGKDTPTIARREQPANTHQAPVATLAATLNATWRESTPTKGARLSPSQSWEMESGLARVVFDHGAVAVIEGPAAFSVISPTSARLTKGKVVVSAGPKAHGFVVNTPVAVVTDLGTEFAVRASSTGDSDVFVLLGRVNLSTSAEARRTRQASEEQNLIAGQGRTARSDGTLIDLRESAAAFIGPSQFDAMVSATAHPLPTGWSDADIGLPRTAGSAMYTPADGKWTVRGGGADLFEIPDQFHFVSHPIKNDATIIARVVTLERTGDHAKAGLMIRAGEGADATYVHVFVTPLAGKSFQGTLFECRETRGKPAQGKANIAGKGCPRWLKLTRGGDSFAAFMSDDGDRWVPLGGRVTIPMRGTVRAGLVAAANNPTADTTATFTDVRLSEE